MSRSLNQIDNDIAAAKRTADGASSALDKIANTFQSLKSALALGGDDAKLRAAMVDRETEKMRREAAEEALASLEEERSEAMVLFEQRKQEQLVKYAEEIKQAKADAALWRKRKAGLVEAMGQLNELSDLVTLSWLPSSFEAFQPTARTFDAREWQEQQHDDHCRGKDRMASLERAIDQLIADLEAKSKMTPEQLWSHNQW